MKSAPRDKDAVRFCGVGAIMRATAKDRMEYATDLEDRVTRE